MSNYGRLYPESISRKYPETSASLIKYTTGGMPVQGPECCNDKSWFFNSLCENYMLHTVMNTNFSISPIFNICRRSVHALFRQPNVSDKVCHEKWYLFSVRATAIKSLSLSLHVNYKRISLNARKKLLWSLKC